MNATVTDGGLALGKTSGAYAISDVLIIDGGNAQCTASNQIQNNTTSSVYVNTGGEWDIGANNQAFGNLYLHGGPVVQSGGILYINTLLDMKGTAAVSGPLVMNSSTTQIAYTSIPSVTNTGDIFGTLDLGGSLVREITVNDDSAILYINGAISNGGILKDGAGTIQLATPAGSNTFASGINITAGTLETVVANTLPNTGTINLSVSGTTFNVNDSDQDIGNLVGVSGTSVTLGSNLNTTLTLGEDGGSSEFDGVISGAGTIISRVVAQPY